MHSEPLTGTTAFWLTRPIKKSEVLKSKMLFCGIFFILLPIVTNIVLLAANRVPVAYILASVPETLLSSISGLLLLMTLSVLTRSFGRFALAGGGYLIISIVLGVSIGIFQRFYLQDSAPTAAALADSRALLSELAGILFLSAIIFCQYRTRRTGRVFALLAMELILVLCIGLYSPWTIFRMPSGTLTEKETEGMSLAVDAGRSSYVSDTFSLRGNKNPKKDIQGELQYFGLPTNCFAIPFKIDATFSTAETTLTSEVFENARRYSSRVYEAALEQTLDPLQLIKKNGHSTYYSTLLKIPASDYLLVQNVPGIYRADVAFNVFRYQPVATLPLEVNAEYSNKATRQSIESILQETQGCTVILRKQSISPLFKRDRSLGGKHLYLLVNRKNGEAYLPERETSVNFRGSTGSSLSINNTPLRFSSIDKKRYINPIDENWLKDAELMIIEVQWLGEVEKQVGNDTFSFGKSGGSSQMKPGTSAKDNKEALAKIMLTENATRDEVNAYIQKINEVSATQSSRNSTDPQVDMLAAVGPENVDLLVQETDRFNSYNIWAINKIAGPQHKELILQNLSRLPDLISVVVKQHWEMDARDTLLNGLKGQDYLPEEWVSAVVGFEDPKTYPALVDYFLKGRNRAQTYRIIKNLPAIQLDAAVAKVWSKVKYGSSPYECRGMIPIAMEYGHVDSLEFAVRGLIDDESSDYFQRQILRSALHRHVGLFSEDTDFRTWLIANEGAIRFDPETKMFVGKEVSASTGDTDGWQGWELPDVRIQTIPGTRAKDNLEKLAQIKLPENPTRTQVKEYIRNILSVSATQSSCSVNDPQVDMLTKIGPENLDLLVPLAGNPSHYEVTAIQFMVRPEHKDLILNNLQEMPSLAGVVLAAGWQRDARDILLDMLRGKNYVEMSIVKAVAALEDPETYPLLLDYFVNGAYPLYTYNTIKNLPGIDLAEAFQTVWEKALSENGKELLLLVDSALERGIQDALRVATEALNDEGVPDYRKKHLRTSFEKYTGIGGTDEQLRKWYLANKGALHFDLETKMFYGTQLVAPQSETQASSAE
jgi:hypothetical protein